MNPIRTLYHLARADLLERMRRYSFLVTIGLTVILVFSYLPARDAGYLTLGLGNSRGIYNAAWVGSVAAVLCSVFLALPGFYLIKNAILRDQETGVGQILATTPMSNLGYVIGKMTSNFAFLVAMVAVVMGASICAQLVRAESSHLHLWSYAIPLVLIALPAMGLVSAVAVFFETIPWLSGGFGNVVYFFLWMAMLIASFGGGSGTGGQRAAIEPFGATVVLNSMTQRAFEVNPLYQGAFSIGAVVVRDPLKTFLWDGVAWTPQSVLGRMVWFAAAMGICLCAVRVFRRFDPHSERSSKVPAAPPEISSRRSTSEAANTYLPGTLTPIRRKRANGIALFYRILLAELKLIFKGLRWWWYVVALGLSAACWFAPMEVAREIILPAAWIWPILLWSPLGNRENRHGTYQLIYTGAHSLRYQFPALYSAGVIVCLLTGMGWGLRSAMHGLWGAFFIWCVGACFIPALAIALGSWIGSSKPFEVSYVILWYAGPMSHLGYLDFMGTTQEAMSAGVPRIYIVVTAFLLVMAVIGRLRRARM